MRRLISTFGLIVMAACAGAQRRPDPLPPGANLPALELAPAAFGDAVSLSQRLSFAHEQDPGGPRSLEALLEIDSQSLRLAGFAFGQRLLTLQWDGASMQEQRDPHVPAQLQSRQVLRDIQLVYWPAESLRAALPEGWTLEDSEGRRALLEYGREWVTVRYDGSPRWVGHTELVNLAEHYRLTIESHPAEP